MKTKEEIQETIDELNDDYVNFCRENKVVSSYAHLIVWLKSNNYSIKKNKIILSEPSPLSDEYFIEWKTKYFNKYQQGYSIKLEHVNILSSNEAMCVYDEKQLHNLYKSINKSMEYTKEQIEEFKKKANKWDALGEKIAKCYCNKDEEYDEDNPENEGADLITIGEISASAFGWL